MTETARQVLFTMLKTMNSSAGNAWTDAQYSMYTLALEGIDDELILQVAKEMVKTCKWRPSPAELLEMAVNIASPIPTETEVYNTICNAIAFATGYESVHKLTQDVVNAIGGWWNISYNTEVKFLNKLVSDAYKLEAEFWDKTIKMQLALPPEFRDLKYFPVRETTPKLETKTELRLIA